MVSAMVLINTQVGKEKSVLEKLRAIDGVEEAHALYSVYDIAIKIKTSSIEKLREIITLRIKKIIEVTTSLTLLTADEK